ncbi:MAG: DUF4139 domain-containing protein [Desulfovibrionales bacterium]
MRTTLTLLFLALACILPWTAQAAPTEVTLYPDSGLVQETVEATVQRAESGSTLATFTLPPQADVDTARVRLSPDIEAELVDIHWERVDTADLDLIAELKERLDSLIRQREQLDASLGALESELLYWEHQAKTPPAEFNTADNLASSIRSAVKEARIERFTLQRERQETQQQIDELQEQINRMTGAAEQQWQGVVTLSGTVPEQFPVHCVYVLTGCGWAPIYRVEARPDTRTVQFGWDAEVWQSTGTPWSDVRLLLATTRPDRDIQPPDLPDWVIRPLPRPMPRKAMDQRNMLESAAPMAGEAESFAPAQEQRATFSLWNLGKRTIPPGERRRLQVRSEAWRAEFLHLLRPEQANEAFVRAQVTLDEAIQLPPGPVFYFLDGSLLGQRRMDFAGKELTLFFGSDPLVTGEMELLDRKSGTRGIFSSRQTYLWDYAIPVANARSEPVSLRVEVPLPRSRAEEIEISVTASPELTGSETDRDFWSFSLPGGEEKRLGYTVSVQAPEEMELDLGR